MYELPLYEAARFIGCTQRWLHMLLRQEVLSSTHQDELETYLEKRYLIHDSEFHEYLRVMFLDNIS